MISRRHALRSAAQLAAVSLVPRTLAEAATATPPAPLPNLLELEALARGRMDPMAWEYFDSGNADDITLRWNREAFERMGLRPRFLGDLSTLTTGIRLLGQELAFPILIAPAAFHRMIHPDGEIGV